MKGLGIDAVEIDRFRRSLERTPSLRQRLFVAAELDDLSTRSDPVPGLAARFAAREATMKALGVGLGGIDAHDVWVSSHESGEPRLHLDGRAALLAANAGITSWHLSLTHTETTAIAVVIAE